MGLRPSRPLRQQPQEGFALDLGNPVTQALSFAWVASGPDINLVTGRKATPQGTVPSKAPYHNRIGRKFNATGSLDFGNSPEVNFAGLSQQTVFAGIYMPDTSTGNATGYILGHVESAWDYHMYVDSGSQQLSYAAGGDSFGNAHFPATSFGGGLKSLEGRPVALVGTYDRVNQKLFIDGVLKSSFANSNAFSSTADRFAIGARGGGGQGSATGINVDIVLIFKRVLTDAEILSLSLNPWQVFKGGSALATARIAAIAASAVPPVGTTYTASVSDTLTLSDLRSATYFTAAQVADILSAADTASAGSATTSAAVADSLTISDSYSARLQALAALIDSLGVADQTYTTGATYTAAGGDILSVTDVRGGQLVASAASADSLTPTELLASTLIGMTDVALPASKIPKSRWVTFEGGTHVVVFDGGTRVVVYESLGGLAARTVKFDGGIHTVKSEGGTHVVVFDGGGGLAARTVVFDGGIHTVKFDGGTRVVTF